MTRVVTNVPFLDLKRQYSQIKTELDEAVLRVIETQQFILGPEVSSFENDLAKYCGASYAVGCSSGTDALILSLLCEGIGKGDEVITTPFTFFATVESILRVGARPVFVDIDSSTFNLDTSKIESKITERTRAIMPVHLFGQCANMDDVLGLASQYDLAVIEDAAQSIGATWNGKKSGSMGDYGCFSFFPGKNLGCFGDGGAVVTSSEERYKKLVSLRQHGLNPDIKYDHTYLGGNFRLDALQAAVLRVKLRHIDKWNGMRNKNAEYYTSSLSGSGLVLPHVNPSGNHVFNQYSIRSKSRDRIRKKMLESGVPTACYYPFPASTRLAVPEEYRNDDLPVCNSVCDDIFAVPVFPDLTQDELDHVVISILESIK